MLDSRRKIRQTHISTQETIIRSLPLAHADLKTLREHDVFIAGIDEREAPQEWGEGVSPTHLIFYVVAGQTTYLGAREVVDINPGQLVIVPGGVAKRFSITTGALRAVWYHLSDTAVWSHLRADGPTVLSTTNGPLLATLQQQLRHEAQFADVTAHECCRQLSTLIVQYLTRDLQPHASVEWQRLHAQLSALWGQVQADPAHDWTVAELAEIMQVSTGHLHRLVRTHQHARPHGSRHADTSGISRQPAAQHRLGA